MNHFLATLLWLAGQHSNWSTPFQDGDDIWTKNDYINIPKNRQMVSYERDVNDTCSKIFGPYSNGGRWGGCTTFGTDDDGLMSTVFAPSRGAGPILDHEEKHAAGWVHPWPGFPNPFQ